MPIEWVNRDLLQDNDCFGCGHLNINGLKIAVFRDPENKNRLMGEFHPGKYMTGFPGITHGGVVYTALDCLASWTPTILRSEKAAWILHSSRLRYLRPALRGAGLFLSSMIQGESEAWTPVLVQTHARDESGKLLVEGRFKLVPLTPERFKNVSGLKEIPENWRHLLREGPSASKTKENSSGGNHAVD